MGQFLHGRRCGNGLELRFDLAGLGLVDAGEPKTAPVRVDFSAGAIQRRSRDSLRGQNLLRAIGNCEAVLDATAGLGRDAFLMASAGKRVRMLECHPVVHALLADGLRRAGEDPDLAPTIAGMTLEKADFLGWKANGRFDAVYLDPMFPKPEKRARGKKEMAFLQRLVNQAESSRGSRDSAASELLPRALGLARGRVVVKRPSREGWMNDCKPDFSYRGRLSRFDVYLVRTED